MSLVERYNASTHLIKRVGHPFNVFESPEWTTAIKYPHKAMLGHNRYATIGVKTEENAHPFEFEHIIGAHNGTLDAGCLKNLDDSAKYGTDSEAIYATINRIGVEDTIPKISGAWALTWFDKRNNSINFLRNDQRPLHYCYSKDRCTLIWSSEKELLLYAMNRRGKEIFGDKDGGQIYQPAKNTMHSWILPPNINDKFDSPKQVVIEGSKTVYPVKSHAWYMGSYDYHNSAHVKETTTANTSGVLPFKPTNKAKYQDTKNFRPPYKDSYNHTLNKQQFNMLVSEGCCVCSASFQRWGDFIKILGPYQGAQSSYLCEDCYNKEDLRNIANYAI